MVLNTDPAMTSAAVPRVVICGECNVWPRASEDLNVDNPAGNLEYAQSECESLFKGVANVLV